MTEPFLSKSKFIAGLQCPKLLWTHYNDKRQIPEPDPSTQAIFDQGQLVGELATSLFPGGIMINWTEDFEEVTARSKAALLERRPIFETSFTHGRAFARRCVRPGSRRRVGSDRSEEHHRGEGHTFAGCGVSKVRLRRGGNPYPPLFPDAHRQFLCSAWGHQRQGTLQEAGHHTRDCFDLARNPGASGKNGRYYPLEKLPKGRSRRALQPSLSLPVEGLMLVFSSGTECFFPVPWRWQQNETNGTRHPKTQGHPR